MPLDLSLAHVRKQLAQRIKDDIDTYCVRTFNDGHRSHLGTSLIGHDCSRYLWYTFRWCKNVQFNGRIYRLFQRGHWEEPHYVSYLEGIGFKVWVKDENGKQFRLASCGGHFGGSMDGAAQSPPQYDIGEPLLLEFKTHNTGKHWVSLMEKGVVFQEPKHFIQMSIYGRFQQLRYALYLNTNKNDDDLYVEIVKLDWSLADNAVAKANEIILAREPPQKLSESATYYKCKHCDFVDVCHNGEAVAHNCRSCKHASPVDGAQWHCGLYNKILTREEISVGCSHHLPIA